MLDKVIAYAKDCQEQEEQWLDCIYDDSQLGFEDLMTQPNPKLEAHDPLDEINLGDETKKRPTFINRYVQGEFKENLIGILKEYKDCFAWDCEEMPGLDRSLVENRLPIYLGRKPVKQAPRRFAPEVVLKIKEEIERLLRVKFIVMARYVGWMSNVVPVVKKNGTLRVCIDFRDLNAATPKDKYRMPVVDLLVDSAAGNKVISLLYGYSGYNQIFIDRDYVPKTTFR